MGYTLKVGRGILLYGGMVMTLEKFYQICDEITPDEFGCMFWPGIKWKPISRYGVIRVSNEPYKNKHYIVSRLILERKLGRPIKSGYCAIHSCDHGTCVNPNHIREGSQEENMQDKWKEGGYYKRKGWRHG